MFTDMFVIFYPTFLYATLAGDNLLDDLKFIQWLQKTWGCPETEVLQAISRAQRVVQVDTGAALMHNIYADPGTHPVTRAAAQEYLKVEPDIRRVLEILEQHPIRSRLVSSGKKVLYH